MPRAWQVVCIIAIVAILGCGVIVFLSGGPAADSDSATPKPNDTVRWIDQTNEPIDIVPADCMLAWYGRPLPDSAAPDSGPSVIDQLLAGLPSVAGNKLEPGQKLGLRILQACSYMVRYDHVVALIDSSAKQAKDKSKDSRQLDDFKLAMIVKTDGKSDQFGLILDQAINEQTDQTQGKLETLSAEGWEYRQLTDSRLPPWCRIAFGNIGQFFVLTVGDGVFPEIASVAAGKAQAIGTDPWILDNRDELGKQAVIEIFVGADKIRRTLDPLVHNRVTEFFKAWNVGDMHRAHWALGLNGQTLYCITNYELEDETVRRVYARPDITKNAASQLIPEGSRHSVFEISAAEFLTRLIDSCYVWQTEGTKKLHAERWQFVQDQYKFDSQKNILDHLGDTLIIHNYPEHEMKLPVFFTTLIEIESDGPQVRKTLNRLCRAWQFAIEREMREHPTEEPIELNQDGDIWYFQMGFVMGLAWTFTDEYIVVSYRPSALEDYLSTVSGKIGR